jgi:arginase family enzyme
MSALRGRCPNCRTFTAVAVGDAYECHSCGATFSAGVVRVPRAWGVGGEAMAEAARVALPYPEVAVIERDSLGEQTDAIAAALAVRPIVVGGCCCSHVGAATGVSRRIGRLGLVWLDAHGDLNTPESSPSGNQWGMPLRMIVDSGAVEPKDVVLIGARNLDPPEEEFIRTSGLHTGEHGIEAALDGSGCTYVALDCDVLEPSELSVFMPEPEGLSISDVERILSGINARTKVLGAGFSGGTFDSGNVDPLTRFAGALGL